jgi:hypothetical protein
MGRRCETSEAQEIWGANTMGQGVIRLAMNPRTHAESKTCGVKDMQSQRHAESNIHKGEREGDRRKRVVLQGSGICWL